MEPVTTTVAISGIVAYLGNKLSKEKSITGFFSEFTEATVNWIKPLFLKDDGTEKEAIKNLKKKPDSPARQKNVESILEIELEDNPNAESLIREMFEKISKTEEGRNIVNNIINSKNVVKGNIQAGGKVIIGDNNK